jgi:hypothetical protein
MSVQRTKASAKKTAAKPAPKRPAVNPPMPDQTIETLTSDFNNIRRELENYAAHLRALDRKRLNGIGIKTQGFIERAYEYAAENPEFLPHYFSLEKFREDYAYFTAFRNLYDIDKQIQEILWNITIQAADMVYMDSLEFYALVREAAKRRVDASETIYKDLEQFFKKNRTMSEGGLAEQTEKKTKRDVNALLHGKRNGKIVIENIKPKVTGGKHKIIDEKFTDSEQYKETVAGEID